MPLIFPTYSELSAHARAELRRRQPAIDPTIFGSFARPFIDSAAALSYSIELLIRDLSIQLFPQGAEGEFLDRWGDYEGLARNPPAAAFGFISLPAVNGTVIPAGTLFTAGNDITYQASAVAVAQEFGFTLTSLTRSGFTVTAVTSVDHSLASGLMVTISGATQSQYNGSFEIIVTNRNQFTYEITSSPATPATGSIIATSTYASVMATATTAGSVTNLSGSSVLNLSSTILGATSSGFAQFDGMSGGTELESDSLYRARILLSRSIIEGVFTENQVRLAALGVPGNTRVYVTRPELVVADPMPAPGFTPTPGQVAVYILRDNDPSPIPTPTILQLTKDAIIANGKLPAHTSVFDVFVFAPITVPVNFVFTALSPDTPTMRTAVVNTLTAFFQDKVNFEQDIREASFLGEIQNTQDLITGDFINSFTLSSPTADIVIGAGEIGILGTVTFP